MDPTFMHDQPRLMEGSTKNSKDAHHSSSKYSYPLPTGHSHMQVFDDSALLTADGKKNRKQKDTKRTNYDAFPKKGTFESRSYQELMLKSRQLFEKRHQILAKLS